MPVISNILKKIDPTLPYRSRIHPLTGYIPTNNKLPCLIKREDELHPNTVGGKLRKYLSLLPAIEAAGVDEVILIGSAFSNNLIGLTHFLRQRKITVHLFIKDPGNREWRGNLLMLHLLLPDSAFHLIPGEKWPVVESLAKEFSVQKTLDGGRLMIIPEGGDTQEVIPGLLSIGLDLQENLRQLPEDPIEIWIDSGTGISAIGLLLSIVCFGLPVKRVNITLIAGDESEFHRRYARFRRWAEPIFKGAEATPDLELCFHRPISAPSFGAINRRVINETIEIARTTGILMDPTYSVKHLMTVKAQIENTDRTLPQLIIYNGGTLGLCGFQERLAEQITRYTE